MLLLHRRLSLRRIDDDDFAIMPFGFTFEQQERNSEDIARNMHIDGKGEARNNESLDGATVDVQADGGITGPPIQVRSYPARTQHITRIDL